MRTFGVLAEIFFFLSISFSLLLCFAVAIFQKRNLIAREAEILLCVTEILDAKNWQAREVLRFPKPVRRGTLF